MADVRPHDLVRAPNRNTADDLVGRVLASRYRLRRVIGTGASGRVYEADDVQLGRRVAVKVLHQALADDHGFLQRFRSEARVAASLQQRNIVIVHDWSEDDTAFMVTELLEGGSLRAMLDAGARLTPAQAARLGRDVAGALEYAHARGIVHRDIKPANLLFDEHASVRIADFGLARALAEASWTEPAGTVFGTARYASPEQAQGIALDARSDLYSLALVLYEAITGTIPFAADTALGSLAQRTQHPITAPVEWGPLRAVIERAGRIDPNERYPTAATMVAALNDACDALGRPAPLPLAGLRGGAAVDPHPTALASTLGSTSAEAIEAIEANPNRPSEPVGRVIDLRDVDVPELFDQDAAVASADAGSTALFDQDAALADGLIGGGDSTVDPTGRRKQRMVPYVVMVAVAAVLAIASYTFASSFGGPAIAIPGVVGYTETEARARAESAGVEVKVETRETDDPAGVVVAQRPAAGVRSDGTLTIVVSSGPPPVETPMLLDLRRDDAKLAATDAGLVPVVEERYDEQVRRGIVIDQTPGVGVPAERDSTITIVVSKGPAPVALPDLEGDVPDDAQSELEELGFTVTRVEDWSDTVDVGDVIGTRPPAGEQAEYGSAVELVVSKGPELVPVPNVFGQDFDSACAEIEKAGFTCDTENYTRGATVQNQDPQPGEKLRRGESVTMFF
jgi:eukaryotic-like serine/threonine-protein kinase